MQKATILSNAEVQERYPANSTLKAAKLAREAIEKGYQIALVESDQFSICDGMTMLYQSQIAIETQFPGKVINNCFFVDMGHLKENKLVVAFNVKGTAVAHGFTDIRLSDH